jgi:hypothetical protein
MQEPAIVKRTHNKEKSENGKQNAEVQVGYKFGKGGMDCE